jgi:hypothetical protein
VLFRSPAKLNASGDLLVPENSIILWDDTDYTYRTTVSATQPTADRTLTLPDATGTVALTANIPSTTDSLSQGSTNKYFSDELAQDAVATALAAGSHTNITVTYNDVANSLSLAAAPGYVDEQAVDAVAAALAAGTHTNISVGYNDAGNAISLTGAVTYTDENAQDAIGNAVGTGLSYNDTTGAISVDTTAIQTRVTDVSDTEIGYLNGVTSSIQTQLNGKAASTIIPAVSTGATTNVFDNNSFSTPLDRFDAGSYVSATQFGFYSFSTALTSTDVALFNASFPVGSAIRIADQSAPTVTFADAIVAGAASLTGGPAGANSAIYFNISNFSGTRDFYTSFYIQQVTPSTAGKYLTNDGTSRSWGTVSKTTVGLANVDNTSDANKPVSTATQTALDLKAPLASPTFTGTVAAASLTLSGDLTVNGTTTTLNSTTMSVDDKNIELGSVATPSDATADGGGITLKGTTDKTFNWVDATDAWTSSEHVNLASGKSLYLNGTLLKDATETLTNKTINANANTITATSANVSDFNEAAQDAVGTILSADLVYNDSTPGIALNYVTVGNTLLDGVSGSSYGLIGTSTYLDVKNTNGYNKEIELDIAAVKTQLNTDGYITTSSTSTLTNKTLTSPKINEDVAVTATATELNVLDGITSTTAELNILDGVTSTAAELNILDGVTSTAAELNILDGVTSTAAELNILDGATLTVTELNYVDGVTSAIQTQLDGKVDESLFDTKGDILVASADNTPAKLAAGTNGYLLTANSAATNGVEWAAAPVSLPSQTGNSGKYLTTDGTDATWGTLVVPITTGTSTVSANTATTIDTTALSAFTSIEYMVSLKQGSKIRTSKVVVQTDGTSVDMTEFAITETGGTIAGVVISATTASTNAVLQLTATDAATTNVTVKFSKVAL